METRFPGMSDGPPKGRGNFAFTVHSSSRQLLPSFSWPKFCLPGWLVAVRLVGKGPKQVQ